MDPLKWEVRMDVEDRFERIGTKGDTGRRKEWQRVSGVLMNHTGWPRSLMD
jgi:hypothetical protein